MVTHQTQADAEHSSCKTVAELSLFNFFYNKHFLKQKSVFMALFGWNLLVVLAQN